MYTHFQQIIRHRCVRAFQTRRGCAYGTLTPVTNIGRGEKPSGHEVVSRTTLAPSPGSAPHSHPTSVPQRPRSTRAHKKAAPQMRCGFVAS